MTETSGQRLARLLALVPWLARNDGVSIRDAAEHFGISPEDLERDLWLVVCCGLPGHGPDQLIDIQFWGDDGHIHVIDPQSLERPLRLSGDEATSLLVGVRLLAQVPGDHDRAALATASAKLEMAAGEALAGGQEPVIIDETDVDVRQAIDAALSRSRALGMVYLSATRDAVTERVVDPIGVLHDQGHTYLEAWCRKAEALRTFRTDRILRASVLEESMQRPSPGAVSVLPAEGVEVVLGFTPRGRWVLEGLAVDVTDRNPDGSGRGCLLVADPEWLVRLVLAHAGEITVEAPSDLRTSVRERALAALAPYEAEGPSYP